MAKERNVRTCPAATNVRVPTASGATRRRPQDASMSTSAWPPINRFVVTMRTASIHQEATSASVQLDTRAIRASLVLVSVQLMTARS